MAVLESHRTGWTDSEDTKLVELLLEKTKEGDTVKEAMASISDDIKRTPEACLFRWYGTLSKHYRDLYEEAKNVGAIAKVTRDRKKEQQAGAMEEHVEEVVHEETLTAPVNIQPVSVEAAPIQPEVIDTTQNFIPMSQRTNEDIQQVRGFIENAIAVAQENRQLKAQIEEMKRNFSKVLEENKQLNDDVQMYSQIFDKARKMVVDESIGVPAAGTSFKMDRNGNLERR